jgi:CMP-N-acetylneuraminic acid synthetase
MRMLCGTPFYHPIMNTLLKSNYIGDVIVNTDSNNIANDIINHFKAKAKVIMHPVSIRGDYIQMNDIIIIFITT